MGLLSESTSYLSSPNSSQLHVSLYYFILHHLVMIYLTALKIIHVVWIRYSILLSCLTLSGLWNPNAGYLFHRNLSWTYSDLLNLVRILTPYFFKIHFNNILPYTHRSLKEHVLLRFQRTSSTETADIPKFRFQSDIPCCSSSQGRITWDT
jgi:hypothetical protein